MFKCQLTDSFTRCQYRSCISGDFYCTAKYAGCGFRLEEKEDTAEMLRTGTPEIPAVPYVRKPRWYESYYPDTRPVK